MEGDDSTRAESALRLAQAQRRVAALERELEIARGQAALQRSNAQEEARVAKILKTAVRAAEADLAPVPMLLETIRRTGRREDFDELAATLDRVRTLLDAAMREPIG